MKEMISVCSIWILNGLKDVAFSIWFFVCWEGEMLCDEQTHSYREIVTVFDWCIWVFVWSVKLSWFGFSGSVGWETYVKNLQWPRNALYTQKNETGVWKLEGKRLLHKKWAKILRPWNGVGHASLLPRRDKPCVFFCFNSAKHRYRSVVQ